MVAPRSFRGVASLLLLFSLLAWVVPRGVASVESENTKIETPSRLLDTTLTTTSCSRIRTGRYKARLELFYFYLVEYESDEGNSTAKPDLSGIELAIATALAAELGSCDQLGRPLFAIPLSDGDDHKFTTGGESIDVLSLAVASRQFTRSSDSSCLALAYFITIALEIYREVLPARRKPVPYRTWSHLHSARQQPTVRQRHGVQGH